MGSPVKCTDCGFLGLRHITTRALMEAELQYRKTGSMPDGSPVEGCYQRAYADTPICFRSVVQYADEALSFAKPPNVTGLHWRVDALRYCEQFVPWREGFSPKEHSDMIEAAALKKEQADEKSRLEAREEARDKATRKHEWWTLIVAVAAVLASIIAPFLQRASQPPVVNVESEPPVVNVAPPPAPVVNIQLPEPAAAATPRPPEPTPE